MALQDFIKKLEEQDDSDVIYSKSSSNSIKVIPPVEGISTYSKDITGEKSDPIKVLPPEEEKPKVIKFKISNFGNVNVDVNRQTQPVREPRKEYNKVNNQAQPRPTAPRQPDPTSKKEVKPEPKRESEEERIEILFALSDTSISKKAAWIEYYHKAQESKKSNSVVNRVREGKFMISDGGDLVILPDYDTHNKDANAILRDKWL